MRRRFESDQGRPQKSKFQWIKDVILESHRRRRRHIGRMIAAENRRYFGNEIRPRSPQVCFNSQQCIVNRSDRPEVERRVFRIDLKRHDNAHIFASGKIDINVSCPFKFLGAKCFQVRTRDLEMNVHDVAIIFLMFRFCNNRQRMRVIFNIV